MMDKNEDFGLPPVAGEVETAMEKVARLRAAAAAQVAKEFDEDALMARFLAEARTKRTAQLAGDEVELPTDTSGLPAEYVKVNIFRGQNKQDLGYVPLQLNGLVIKVPRGVDVILPRVFVTDCLALCVETITSPAYDTSGRLSGIELRDSHRFPYSEKGPATTAEYKAFQAQQLELAARQTARAA
jgi:hypothetical protein